MAIAAAMGGVIQLTSLWYLAGLLSDLGTNRRHAAMSWQLNKQRLGDLLIELGHITEYQLAHALDEPRRCGERIGETLVRLGFIGHWQLRIALARQYGRALAGALGMMVMTIHPELAAAAIARAQLAVSATVVTAAASSFRLVGSAAATGSDNGAGKLAVTLACPGGGRAQIGVERGRFEGGGAVPSYVQTWKSAMLKTLTCGAEPQSTKVALAASLSGGAAGTQRTVNVTIDY
jgi:hypothetical protein